MEENIYEKFKEAFKDCYVTENPEYVMIQRVVFWCRPTIEEYASTYSTVPTTPDVMKITVSYAVAWQEAQIVAKNNDFWIIREQIDRAVDKEVKKAESTAKKEK